MNEDRRRCFRDVFLLHRYLTLAPNVSASVTTNTSPHRGNAKVTVFLQWSLKVLQYSEIQDTQVDVLHLDVSVHQPSVLSDLLGGSTSMDVDVDIRGLTVCFRCPRISPSAAVTKNPSGSFQKAGGMNMERREYTRCAIVLSGDKTTIQCDKNTQFTTEQFVLCNFVHFFPTPHEAHCSTHVLDGRGYVKDRASAAVVAELCG
jgi:hypothetical protein